MGKNSTYWICQIAGWGLYGFFGLAMMAIFSPGQVRPFSILNQFLIVGIQLLLSHAFRLWIKRYEIFKRSTVQWVPLLLAGIVVTGFLTQLIVTPMVLLITPENLTSGYKLVHSLGYFGQAVFIFAIWSAIYAAVHFVRNYRQAEIDKWKLEAEVQKAELMALKAQINPHFMFNALNSIRSLIAEDTDNARLAVTKLSNLLRYAIQFQARELVTVQEEVEIVQGYLTLEKIQLENRLNVEYAISDEVLADKIPAMSIQMLAENAVKHGIAPLAEGGIIKISAKRDELGELQIAVKNSGNLDVKKSANGTGIGLKNVESRLKALLNSKATVLVNQKEENLVEAILTIPHESTDC
ncbi:MAG: histidine kinase [Bacteroidota bacterium]